MASLDHLNLTVKDFDSSAAWYLRVFGFVCVERGTWKGNPWGILRSQDSMLCIYEDRERESPTAVDELHPQRRVHRLYHFALAVPDRAVWEETLRRESLRVAYDGAITYPHSTSWYLEDPSGYEIEVVHWTSGKPAFSTTEA